MINRNPPPATQETETFLEQVKFSLPEGFIDFFKESDGADICTDEKYVFLWRLSDMMQMNRKYHVEEYAPDFFVFGSDGADTAFAIERKSGDIYEMPFIGMPEVEAIFKTKNFSGFIASV